MGWSLTSNRRYIHIRRLFGVWRKETLEIRRIERGPGAFSVPGPARPPQAGTLRPRHSKICKFTYIDAPSQTELPKRTPIKEFTPSDEKNASVVRIPSQVVAG